MNSREGIQNSAAEAGAKFSSLHSVDAAFDTANTMQPAPVHAMQRAATTGKRLERIAAIDFTKGTLVLVMVLYHWLSYFHGRYGSIFRYLRFLPPSFIFITGFLVSNAYLRKYEVTDPRLPKRLALRGAKVLAIFVLLNVAISFLFTGFRIFSAESLLAVFVTGNVLIAGVGKAASFYVLVPISYLLLLSAILLIICRYFKHTFWVVCALCLMGVFVLDRMNLKSANLELITIGLLGLILGYVAIEKVNAFVRHPYLVVGANACYLAAITLREPNYPLQVLGVFLTLMLIYLIGSGQSERSVLRRQITLLGKYPLFGYIAQIAILQMLRIGARHMDVGPTLLVLILVAAMALTVASVILLDWARSVSTGVDWLYKAAFA